MGSKSKTKPTESEKKLVELFRELREHGIRCTVEPFDSVVQEIIQRYEPDCDWNKLDHDLYKRYIAYLVNKLLRDDESIKSELETKAVLVAFGLLPGFEHSSIQAARKAFAEAEKQSGNTSYLGWLERGPTSFPSNELKLFEDLACNVEKAYRKNPKPEIVETVIRLRQQERDRAKDRELSTLSENAIVLSNNPEPVPLLDRDRIREMIANLFFGDDGDARQSAVDTVFLTGISGIGKSEIAKTFAREHDFRHVVYGVFDNSKKPEENPLSDMVFNSIKIPNAEGLLWYGRLKAIQQICEKNANEDVLFIIINLNRQTDEFSPEDWDCWEELQKVHCKKLITSTSQWAGYNVVRIGRMDDEYLIKLFDQYAPGINSTADRAAIHEMIQEMDGHTLAVELLAKMIAAGCYEGMTPVAALQKLRTQGLASISDKEIDLKAKPGKTTVLELISRLFQIAEFNEEERIVLYCACLFPTSGIKRRLFNFVLARWHSKAVNRVVEKGWLNYPSSDNDPVTIHPLIAEVVSAEFVKEKDRHEEMFFDFFDYLAFTVARWMHVVDKNYGLPADEHDPEIRDNLERVFSINDEQEMETEEILKVTDEFVNLWIGVADRIVRFDIRCSKAYDFILGAKAYLFDSHSFIWKAINYDKYFISMRFSFASSDCAETEAVYHYYRALVIFDHATIWNGLLEFSEPSPENDMTDVIMSDVTYRLIDEFKEGKNHLSEFDKIVMSLDMHTLPIDSEKLEEMRELAQCSYDEYIQRRCSLIERERGNLSGKYVIGQDGKKYAVTEELIDAVSYWRKGRGRIWSKMSEAEFVVAEENLKQAASLLDEYRDRGTLMCVELPILSDLVALYFRNKKYADCAEADMTYIARMEVLSPDNDLELGRSYFELGLIQSRHEQASMGKNLEKAREHLVNVCPPSPSFGTHRDYWLFQTEEALCYYYEDVVHDHDLAQLHYNLAVSYPIRVFEVTDLLFDEILMRRNEPIRNFLCDWERLKQRLRLLNREKTEWLEKYLDYLAKFSKDNNLLP